jgi:tetrathionate reductase subunit A
MRKLSRRTLLKLGVAGGAGALLGPEAASLLQAKAQNAAHYTLNDPTRCIQSSCLQCNTGCPIKVKIQDGVAAKIDGNPVTPFTMYPHLPYDTSLATIAATDGSLCARGQAGIQSAYDPYRIRKVLKRAGPRGSGQWQEIPFEQAVREVAQGGRLFTGIGDDRVYPGVADAWAVRDPAVMRALSSAVSAIVSEKDRAAKTRLVEQFKVDFRDHLDAMIDPDHPDLGPKNNEITFAWGRLKAGRREFLDHFFRDTLGTVNMHGHTTVCQGSLYFTAKAMSDQFVYDAGKGRHDWSGGRKSYWQADLMGTEFVIVVGSNILEGGYGMPLRTSKITQAGANGKLKIAVVDPRALKLNNYAERWLAPKPGEDAAIALGMMRWMFEHGRYDARFLAAANKAGATAAGETTWTNSTWLVKIGADGAPGSHLRASDLGLEPLALKVGDRDVALDAPIVMIDGVPTPFDPNDATHAIAGDLFVDATIAGHRVKSGLSLIREEAEAHTIEAWAEIAGVAADDVRWLAYEFTNHGKRAAIDIHRGVSQHTNGFYNVFAWYTMAALMGVWDWQGGMGWQSNHQITGARAAGPFEIGKLHPSKLAPFGISVIRHERSYESSTIFEGYPAKRPWYPFASDVYQETIVSGAMGYPYRTKILFHYMGDPAYALPAGQTQIAAMLDPDKIGLIVGFDIVVGNSYTYADYIVPDLSYLERWEFHGSHPNVIWKVQPARQPAIAPIPEEVTVFGQAMPISLESFLMGLAQELEAPGYGPGALAGGGDFTHPDHLYLKLAANLAFGERADGGDAVREADDAEVDAFLQARRHLPSSVYDPARWMQIVGDEALWRRTVYMLNRGGRFEDFGAAFASGGKIARRYGQQLNLYLEKLAQTRNSMTGAPYHPLATYLPPYQDALGRPVVDDGYELTLITHRIPTMTKSRTISNYWLLNVRPENHIEVAAADAARLGLRDDQYVRVLSASNPDGAWPLGNGHTKPLVGRVKVREGLRPGTVTFALGYGHWGYGAGEIEIDGKRIAADRRRQTGIQANAAMRIDPHLGDVALSDLVGGSVVFYETKVRLEPA